jgi:hypothetical protein
LYRITPYRTIKSSNGKWAWRCRVCGDEGQATIGNLRHERTRECTCGKAKKKKEREEEKRQQRESWVGEIIGDREVLAVVSEYSWSYRCLVCGYEGQTSIVQMQKQGKCPVCSKRARGINVGVDYTGQIIGTRRVLGKVGEKWAWECTECGNTGATQSIAALQNNGCAVCYHASRSAAIIGTIKDNKKITAVRRGTKGRLCTWVCLRCEKEGEQTYSDFNKTNCSFCTGKLLDKEVLGRTEGSSKTIIARAGKKGGTTLWEWRCDCGNTGVSCFTGARTAKCIACRNDHTAIIPGDRYGCIEVLEKVTSEGKKSRWRCLCHVCGNESTYVGHGLKKDRPWCKWCRRRKPLGHRIGIFEVVGHSPPGLRHRKYDLCCTLCGEVAAVESIHLKSLEQIPYCLDCKHDVLGKPLSCNELGRLLGMKPQHLRRLNLTGKPWVWLLAKYRRRVLK